ncbi:type VI secretion system Vgr family protein [Polyangium sorediatum]|uniref:Type VI secretion system tip protein TssI/VgrG n=1 Tax=Polyangium sorediatum TaxID=889274 RepID=A0ABT6P4E7_9BACT|nr:type VI secretion system tip protein TssI/VgrG [Polyangium sorediatum]MDI1435463.1 type VI secretion system tip protein TssI/VgrG [Polyangium sorediatum]
MSTTNHATIEIASGDFLDVRTFAIKQGINQLFHIDVRAVSRSLDIDFDEVIGKPASFRLRTSQASPTWQSICSQIEQVRADAQGLATYTLTLQPRAWLMTQRKNYRIFQFETELDIVKKMLGEWGIEFEERLDPANYKPRKYRCQYAETDFAFLSRMLEDAGASYYFEQRDDKTVLILDDAPHARELQKPGLRFHDEPNTTLDEAFVTRVAIRQRVRPGKVTIGDLDYRKPSTNQPSLAATGGLPQEQALEQFHYEPGAFLFKQSGGGGSTPTADDRGSSRTDEQLGNVKTQNRLHGKRGSAKRISFESNALDLVPGVIASVSNHPHRTLGADRSLLVTEALIEGDHDGDWRVHAEVVPTDIPYKPDTKTARPKVTGLESASVVGPSGEEIHTDEYGRVRLQFHWDREGKRDETSSCWVPTSQPWAGAGFGGVNLPRIGQEVLVEFLGGDPDRPVVVGRVFTETQPPPYKLPDFKKVSGLRSESSPRLVTGAADGSSTGLSSMGGLLGGQASTLGSGGIAETLNHPFFQAKSPDQQTHSFAGNEVSLFDQPGKQQMYLQAERDMNVVVKNTQTAVVSNARSTRVGTDDVLGVNHKQLNVIGNNQTTSVGGDRYMSVVGTQTHDVTGDIIDCGQKDRVYDTTNTFASAAKVHHLISEEKIILQVGSSTIVMQPNFIVIQADDVFINPGAEETQKAANGERPEKPEEKEAREQKAKDAALEKERARTAWERMNNDYKKMPESHRERMSEERTAEYMKRRWQTHYQSQGGYLGNGNGDRIYNGIQSGDYKLD